MVVQRGGTWRAQIQKRGVRESRTFQARQEALDWIIARESEILAGKTTARKTVGDLLDRYAREIAPQRRGARWEALRASKLKSEDWSTLTLPEFTPSVIAQWRDRRLTEVKAGTVRREMGLLRSCLEVARRDWGWLSVNPISDVRRPPSPRPRDRIITDAERDRMLEGLGFAGRVETVRHEIAVAFLLCLETAMRAGEVLGLTWADVDLKRKVAQLEVTKNGDRRLVPLSSEAVRLFGLLKQKKVINLRTEDDGRIFGVRLGTLDTTFRRVRNKAKLDGFVFHDSRATALTRLARILNPLELARMAGHRDLKSLQVYYREPMESIAERLG